MAPVVLPQTNRMVLMVREYYLFKLYYIAGRPLPARNRLLKLFFTGFSGDSQNHLPCPGGRGLGRGNQRVPVRYSAQQYAMTRRTDG
jgi:hypothetical protein